MKALLHQRVLAVVTWLTWPCGVDGGGFAPGLRSVLGSRPPPLKGLANDGAVFEYIVVGAGAAGSAVAARLALAGSQVLLIEAGGDPGLLSKIPSAAMALTGTDIDWFYDTESNNKSCLSLRGQQCRFSRGRCLGGSTSINYMLYTRGNPHDYDFGVPGWSWRDLKPYFLRYEGLRSLNRLPSSSHPYHNTSGLVEIDVFERSTNPWNQRIMKGLLDLKFPFNSDVNAKSQIGVSRALGYVSRGERVSAATAYLNRRDVKRKLKVTSNMRCTGIILDENNIARGVTVTGGKNNSRSMNLYVTREVILSAGAVGTAQLLMLSGIGIADHLQRIGIPVRVELPVGEHMSDHVLPIMIVKVDGATQAVLDSYNVLTVKGLEAIQWLLIRGGPLASIGVTDVVGFANTRCYDYDTRQLKNYGPECIVPTLQIIFAYIDRHLLRIAPYTLKRVFNTNIVEKILAANENSAFLIISPILLRPKSRGWIRLANRDPLAPPVITPNYLDDDYDVEEIVKSIRIVEHMLQTPSFKRNNASLLKFRFSQCPEVDESGYWECYVRHMTSSAHHAVGTAQLGRVVDQRLRVRGVAKLRVGDASVLPAIPRGNTAAAAFAIGERLADILLEEQAQEP